MAQGSISDYYDHYCYNCYSDCLFSVLDLKVGIGKHMAAPEDLCNSRTFFLQPTAKDKPAFCIVTQNLTWRVRGT